MYKIVQLDIAWVKCMPGLVLEKKNNHSIGPNYESVNLATWDFIVQLDSS